MAVTGRHKIIDGKRFFKFKIFPTKAAANRKAKELRDSGRYLVRVQADDGQWAIFCFEIKKRG